MTYTPEHDLLDYIDKLRKPFKTPHLQKNDAGEAWVGYSEHDGLLKQLRDAIVGGIGAHAGTSSLGSERLPFDVGARALYDAIEWEITNMYVTAVNEPVYLELERVLVKWYQAHLDAVRRGKVDAEHQGAANRIVRGWVHRIEEFFDQPIPAELKMPCPACENEQAWDKHSGNVMSALVALYRIDHETKAEVIEAVRCRFCEQVWHGEHGAREMMRLHRLREDQRMVDGLVLNE